MKSGALLGRTVSFAVAGILTAVAPALPAQDQTFDLKISTWVPPAHPLQKSLEEWGASVEKDSNGTLRSKVYPSQQLGKAFDHYDMARDGIADFTYVNPGYQPGRFPVIGVGELPFLISDAKAGSRALDAWYRKYAEREMKDVKFCFAFVHDPGSFHSRTKKIMVPEDISGMKIRPSNATMATFVTMLGGTNVQSSAPEVRDIIEKGVADAVAFPWGSVPLFGIDKVTKYHMNAPLYTNVFVMAFSKSRYNRMSDAQKKVIDNHCTTEWAGKIADPWADFEHGGIAKIAAEEGHEVYPISDAQLTAWRQAAKPLHKSWADNVRKNGYDPDAVLRELEEALDRQGALAK